MKFRCNSSTRGDARAYIRDRSEAQRIHHRYRTRAHGEDVAQNSAHAGRGTLKWLNERGVVVGLDFEGARPAVADVDDTRVLARPLHYPAAARGQTLQVKARRLVRTVLDPHHAKYAEFGDRRFASAQQLFDLFVLVRREAVLPDEVRSNGKH